MDTIEKLQIKSIEKKVNKLYDDNEAIKGAIADIRDTTESRAYTKFIKWGIGIAALAITSLGMGPVDFSRTVYHQVVGDLPNVKAELFQQCGSYIEAENTKSPNQSTEQYQQDINILLASELDSPTFPADPTYVSTEKLWECSEKHADSNLEKYLWTNIK